MLSQSLYEQLKEEQEVMDIVKYLPEPVEVEEFGTKFGMMRTIKLWDMPDIFSHKEYIARQWHDLYYVLLKKLAEIFIGRKEYFIIRMIPHVLAHVGDDYRIGCFVECMIAPTKSIVIPEFKYSSYNGHMVIEEWRCGHCATPNTMKMRLCTQCGAPRLELIQEIYSDLRNGVDVCNL